MSLLRHFQKDPGVGWCSKELSLAGFKHNSEDTRFILETLSLMKKYQVDSVLLDVIEALHNSEPISPLEDPSYNSEYLVHGNGVWQSNRLRSLFSRDNGLTWYDIDRTSLSMKFFRFVNKFWRIKKEKLVYYVQFPYDHKNEE